MIHLLANYLITKPTGTPHLFLIIAAIIFSITVVIAAIYRMVVDALIALGLGFLVVALLVH